MITPFSIKHIKFDKDNTWRCFEFPNSKPLVGWEEVEVQHQH